MNNLINLEFNGVEIAFENGIVSLTQSWKAAGSPSNKDPRQWIRFEGKEFIGAVAKKLNVSIEHILITSRGRNGMTRAYWQIWLAYTKYLNHDFHMWANQVVKERIEEDINPELGITRSQERAVRAWKRQGKSDSWIENRIKGIENFNRHKLVLKNHGVTGGGYAMCNNNTNCGILGTTAKKYKLIQGYDPKANTRDCFDEIQVIMTSLAEAVSDQKIERENVQGDKPCAKVCYNIAKEISNTVSRLSA